MTFYPDEDGSDGLEIESKYSIEDIGQEEDSDEPDIFLVKSNQREEQLVSGIDHQELRKRIENFKLDNHSQNKSSLLKNRLSKSKKTSLENNKLNLKESLVWYMKISRLPVFLITLYSVLILFKSYLITISSNLTNFAQNISWFDNLKWPFEILIFLLTTYIVIKKKKQLPRIAGFACAIIGFFSGIIITVIKLFWYQEVGNIFYWSVESIFLGVIGLIVGFLSAVMFYKKYE